MATVNHHQNNCPPPSQNKKKLKIIILIVILIVIVWVFYEYGTNNNNQPFIIEELPLAKRDPTQITANIFCETALNMLCFASGVTLRLYDSLSFGCQRERQMISALVTTNVEQIKLSKCSRY